MPWNPETYNEFKNIRFQPFFDLMEMISDDHLENAVDIGCGTGEQTKILSEKFDSTSFLGIDSSAEMLSDSSKYATSRLHFQQSTIEDFANENSNWDLIFSNAALQWTDNHHALFPKIIHKLNIGGQIAIQMPVQNENLLNKILIEMVQEKPFSDFLKNWKRESPVLSIDEYAQIMFDCGLDKIRICQNVYPIIADDEEKLYSFISGTSLIPYLEKLSESEKKLFITEFKSRIKKSFKKFPAIYAFKRLLLYGRKITQKPD